MDPHRSFLSLEHKLLNQHHDDYAAFTRLILSLAVGSFTLLAALSVKLLTANEFASFAKAAFPLLLISILAGLLVQHRIMMNPQWHLEEARKLIAESEARGNNEPIVLRRKPSILERWFYRIQVLTFLSSFIVLAIYLVVASGI